MTTSAPILSTVLTSSGRKSIPFSDWPCLATTSSSFPSRLLPRRSWPMPGTGIPILSSIGELAETSDVWIVDIWGVIHNGAEAYAEACDACRKFRAGGGSVAMLSNAPRPFTAVKRQLDALGVPREAYDLGVT